MTKSTLDTLPYEEKTFDVFLIFFLIYFQSFKPLPKLNPTLLMFHHVKEIEVGKRVQKVRQISESLNYLKLAIILEALCQTQKCIKHHFGGILLLNKRFQVIEFKRQNRGINGATPPHGLLFNLVLKTFKKLVHLYHIHS